MGLEEELKTTERESREQEEEKQQRAVQKVRALKKGKPGSFQGLRTERLSKRNRELDGIREDSREQKENTRQEWRVGEQK